MTPGERIKFTTQNILDALNFVEPKKVPVMFDAGGWAFGYAGVSYEEVHDDPVKCAEAYCKIYQDLPVDTVQTATCGVYPAGMYEALNSRKYYFNEGGVAHDQAGEVYFGPEIYDEVIADPFGLGEKVMRKDFPSFSKPRAEAYEDLKRALYKYKAYNDSNMLVAEKMSSLGICSIQDNPPLYYMSEFSNFFDVYRGIRNALVDLRRRPEKVREACNAIWEASKMMYMLDEEEMKRPLPMGHTMFHPECFLSDQWFDELYFRHFMEAAGPALEAGKKMFLFGEGAFMRHLHRFNETPKGSMAILLDQDDPFEAHKIVGDNCTLICGITTSLLSLGTKQQCVDYVKRIFDEIAPGGGLIFAANQVLVTARDVKTENLFAAYEEADRLSRQ